MTQPAAAGRLAHLCRHPVKSIGFEEIPRAVLTEDRAFPFDREWAVAHEGARFGARPEGWAPKMNFVRGWASPALMAVTCKSDEAARRLVLSHPDQPVLEIAPDDAVDQARLIAWLRPLWPANRPDPAHVIHLPGRPMTDVPDPWVALLSLSSLADLSARMGQDLSIHRFRGNLWVEGWAPWSEFDLVGREIVVGGSVLKIEARITRCRATCTNPATGRQDAEVLQALEAGFGHEDFGVYARVIRGGAVAVGDEVTA